MRTTIRLHQPIFRSAKRFAAERGLSFTALVEESLRKSIYSSPRKQKKRKIRLPKFHGNGLLPGVNIDKTGDLYDRMDDL
jgi:hypothetical protein